MHCQHCGSINGEDDHRCLRCGRRITGVAIAAPPSYVGPTAIGATALAMQAMPFFDPDPETAPARAMTPEQAPLFQTPAARRATSDNLIPFEQVQRQAAARLGPWPSIVLPSADTPVKKPAASPRAVSKKAPPTGQGNLDFRPESGQGERILATGVPAQVYGDGRVAPPMRRLTAGAMDVTMVLLGFGFFAASVRITGSLLGGEIAGSGFGVGKAVWITLSGALILISLFYGLVWALARRETAGMNWTQLQLVTFDGSPLDGRNRAIRFVSAWLSYCSGGLGLLWALADEESLAFHDHISKTYPAEMGSSRVLVRQRR